MRRLIRAFLYSVILAMISILLVASLWEKPFALTVILFFIGIVILIARWNKKDLILYLSIGIAGALAESFAIVFGAWSYGLPQIIGVPYWLPLLWGIAAIFIKEISKEIGEFFN